MRRHNRLPLLCALVAVVASACVSAGKPGVSIDSVQADVVFGLDEAPTPILPANTNPGEIPSEALSGGFEFQFRNPAADRLPPLVAAPTVSECPTAPPTAAADKPADATISGEVREGLYLWKRTGTQTKPNPDPEGPPLQSEIKGFEHRIIRNVAPYDDQFDPDAYTFEMVQTLVDRPAVQVRTFLVKPLTSAQVSPGGAVVVDEPRVNEPEGGVSLIKIEELDENDQSVGTFEPSTGLLQLGLPVDPAETFDSTATDPKTGQTILQESKSVGRSRIDACGDLVDGWRVESMQTGSDATAVAYNYLIATQYGGVPILEEISTMAEDGTTFDVTFSLGQLDPDPLPADS